MANTYTIASTAKYDAILTRIITIENAKLAAQTPPGTPWTEDTYLKARVKDILDSYVRDYQAQDTATVRAKLDDPTLSPAQIAAAKTALGLP